MEKKHNNMAAVLLLQTFSRNQLKPNQNYYATCADLVATSIKWKEIDHKVSLKIMKTIVLYTIIHIFEILS